MKIIAVLESEITGGGAFSQALNAITQMIRICEDQFEFEVFTTHAGNKQYLEKLGVSCTPIKFSLLDKLIASISGKPWWHRIQGRIKFIGPFEKKVVEHNCDLVYFLTQSASMRFLQQTNFITTVFDLCHRDNPEFPEVSNFGVFQAREDHFFKNLAQAFLIITESEHLSDLIVRRYGIDRERCLAIPMSTSPFIHEEYSTAKEQVLKKYNLDEGYFFYPAQFWAHKNHIRILEALLRLRNDDILYRAVFVGSDKGNQKHVENFVVQNSLREQVRFLGFVPAGDMRGLYEGSAALVMPTYFGPTNLPPLEAWTARVPLIYSSQLQDHSEAAAISVNPDDVSELAEAMKQCVQNNELTATLVEKGMERLRHFERLHVLAEKELTNRLQRFAIRRRCWGRPGT